MHLTRPPFRLDSWFSRTTPIEACREATDGDHCGFRKLRPRRLRRYSGQVPSVNIEAPGGCYAGRDYRHWAGTAARPDCGHEFRVIAPYITSRALARIPKATEMFVPDERVEQGSRAGLTPGGFPSLRRSAGVRAGRGRSRPEVRGYLVARGRQVQNQNGRRPTLLPRECRTASFAGCRIRGVDREMDARHRCPSPLRRPLHHDQARSGRGCGAADRG